MDKFLRNFFWEDKLISQYFEFCFIDLTNDEVPFLQKLSHFGKSLLLEPHQKLSVFLMYYERFVSFAKKQCFILGIFVFLVNQQTSKPVTSS